MQHDFEHGLRIQLSTALRERDEAVKERDRQLGCRNLAQKDRNAYELQNEELRKALAAARRECDLLRTALSEAREWILGEGSIVPERLVGRISAALAKAGGQ